MKYELKTMKTADGTIVEYVRRFERHGRCTVGTSIGLWRFTPEQREAIRAGRGI